MNNNLVIVRISYQSDKEIFLLIEKDNYLPAKYVSKFDDPSLTNKEIEYLYESLREGSIQWVHLFCDLTNENLVVA